jgi:hypothetical protein
MQLRAPNKGALFLARKWSDDQQGNDGQSGGDSHGDDQHLSTMPFRPVNTSGTAGGDQSRVKFGRICVLAGPCRACPLGADLKREWIRMNLRTPHGRMVTPTE